MSFEFFVDPLDGKSSNPISAYDSDDSEPETTPRAQPPVVEMGKVEASDTVRHAPGIIFPALAYVLTFAVLFVTTEYSKLMIHLVAVFVGFAVERLRESVVRQLKLDEVGDESIVGVIAYTVPIVIAYKAYQILFAHPADMLLTAIGWTPLEFVEMDRVPMARRRQTLAVLLWTMMIPMVPMAYFFAFTSVFTVPFLSVPYLIWINFIDKAPRNGSRKPILRNLSLGKSFVDYFPITLQRSSAELDPKKKYVFCYHPHGIISLGAIGCFGLDAAGFPELFPGIDRRLLTLDTNFKVPFLRELIMWLGVCSVARESCDAILNRGPGSAICIVVGGAAESLETAEGTYRLVLKRKGFVRVAVENDADLVPVFAFGETDAFSVLSAEKNSKLREWQNWAQKKMGFAVPIFWGRGVVSYNWGFLPKRKPINVVTGEPISTASFRAKNLQGEDLVNAVHAAYVEGLQDLFDRFKDRTEAGMTRTESLRIVQ